MLECTKMPEYVGMLEYIIGKKLQGVEYKLYKGLVPGVICAHTGPYCFAVYVDCE